jgi:hypothetical protein
MLVAASVAYRGIERAQGRQFEADDLADVEPVMKDGAKAALAEHMDAAADRSDDGVVPVDDGLQRPIHDISRVAAFRGAEAEFIGH